MSTSGDTDGWRDGLPDLPPDWGPIVIPDDASALAAEAAQVREELRQQRERERRRRRAALARTPLLILLLALTTTLASLGALTWAGMERLTPPPTPTQRTPARHLPALELIDARGATVSLRSLLPAVILVPDQCDCDEVIAATSAAAPPGVTVIALSGAAAPLVSPPTPVAGGAPVRALADPADALRAHLDLTTTAGTAAVVLVDTDAEIRRILPASTSVEDYRADLALLATR